MRNLFRALGLMLALAAPILAAGPLAAQQLTCNANAQYDASTNGATRIFTAGATSLRQVFVCGYVINVGSVATNVSFSYGTGTNCGTGTVALTPTFVLPAAGQMFDDAGIWHGLIVPAGKDLCINTSAGNPVQAIVYYIYQ
jgi:hypothetical protein